MEIPKNKRFMEAKFLCWIPVQNHCAPKRRNYLQRAKREFGNGMCSLGQAEELRGVDGRFLSHAQRVGGSRWVPCIVPIVPSDFDRPMGLKIALGDEYPGVPPLDYFRISLPLVAIRLPLDQAPFKGASREASAALPEIFALNGQRGAVPLYRFCCSPSLIKMFDMGRCAGMLPRDPITKRH